MTCAHSEDSGQPGRLPSEDAESSLMPRADAQVDLSLRCTLIGKLRNQCFFMRTAKTLIRLDGCPG